MNELRTRAQEVPANGLWCMDGLELLDRLPDGSVDLICTDPPYGLGYRNGRDLACKRKDVFTGTAHCNMEAAPIQGDTVPQADTLVLQTIQQARRVLKKGGVVVLCASGGGPKTNFARWILWLEQYLNFKQMVVWDKGGLGLGMHYRRNYELLLVASKGPNLRVWNGDGYTTNLWRIPREKYTKDKHPTQKPLALMERVIELHTQQGDVVVDPFAGSGSTLVAAARLGRRWLGAELDPHWAGVAQERLGLKGLWHEWKEWNERNERNEREGWDKTNGLEREVANGTDGSVDGCVAVGCGRL